MNLRPLLLFLGAAIAAYTAYFFKNGNEYRFLIMIVAAVVLCEKNSQYISLVVFVSTTLPVIRLDELPIRSMHVLQIIEMTVKLFFPLGSFSISVQDRLWLNHFNVFNSIFQIYFTFRLKSKGSIKLN